MAFLFKSKKHQSTTLPPATRNIHTSEGTPSSSNLSNGVREKEVVSTTPSSSVNNSLNSLGAPNSPEQQQWGRRERAESETQARPRPAMNGPAPATVPNASLYPWSQRRLNFPTPQSNPFPRYGAAVNSVASKEGDIYMMGGLINGSVVKGDLWMVETGGGNLSCYPIATVSEGPGPRVGHSSLLVGNAFIVFGGDTKMDDSDTLDDTLYLLNTSSRQWSRASPPGPKPSGRYGHTLNILGSKIYIFGGQVEGYFFNDLVAFDLNALQNPANQWEFLIRNSGDGGPQPGAVPPARTNHSMVSHNEQLYLFGGTNGLTWFNDVWTYDPRTNLWTQQDCIGYIPAPREGHSAALVNDVMYIFGGRTEEGTDLGDLAAFRISSRRWYTFQNMGPSPSPRSGHSMTAHGKQIIVLAGEPSSAPRDTGELSMVYVLDTAKIRYPNDSGSQPQTAVTEKPSPGARRPSGSEKSAIPQGRSVSREGQSPTMDNLKRSPSAARENPFSGSGPRPAELASPPNHAIGSRLPRASIAQAPAGPPPPGQAPTPKTNGINPTAPGPRSKTPTKADKPYAPGVEAIKAISSERERSSPVPRETPKEPPLKATREQSPSSQGQRTPTGQQSSKMAAKAMEAGEAAPLVTPARQRSLRSQKQHAHGGSIDSAAEESLLRKGSLSYTIQSDAAGDARSSRSLGDEPKSPRLTPHQEALTKELEAVKSRNAWYASELALARKAGYQTSSAASPTFDDRAVDQFGDEDRPLIEAFLAMKAELAQMQQTIEQQSASAAKKMGEVEHQRDAAISEAAYARAKLAAHGGSQRSTPQPDLSREVDEGHPERSTDISRRLALTLAQHAELKTKLESITNEVQSERRARELAEETAEAAQKRLAELDKDRNPLELDALRAELHQTQSLAREEAAQRNQAEATLKVLEVDKEDLTQKHEELSTQMKDHTGSLSSLQAAVAASTEKSQLLEKKLDQERDARESLERKLLQLRSEHEERTSELEATSRRLRDAEELAESHAKEATAHREVLLTGLQKVTSADAGDSARAFNDQRVTALQHAVDKAHALAKSNQEAADAATEKLRAAEERIAGLEAYQEQSSREGLHLRRQLQAALRDVQAHQAENRGVKAMLENQQRDANALAVQHSALKDLLGERGVNISDARRSPMFENSPSSRFGTPEQGRLRELEQQLQSSLKAHEESKVAFESREQEADRTYREKLEQLENDYQSAVHYVKGTEKMLKRMKDELSKYKAQNSRLQGEVEAQKEGSHSPKSTPAEWEVERSSLQKSIEDMRSQTAARVSELESQMSNIRSELASVQSERDKYRSEHEELSKSTQQSKSDLEQLKSENAMLETRAMDAEHKVSMLLDQVGTSVTNYRRQSQLHATQQGGANGINAHNRQQSTSTNASAAGAHERADSGSADEAPFADNRGSLALDSLASELDALRSHWESTNRSYRLSSQFDFERTPTKESSGAGELSDSLANWRKRLEEEEKISTGQEHHKGQLEGGMI